MKETHWPEAYKHLLNLNLLNMVGGGGYCQGLPKEIGSGGLSSMSLADMLRGLRRGVGKADVPGVHNSSNRPSPAPFLCHPSLFTHSTPDYFNGTSLPLRKGSFSIPRGPFGTDRSFPSNTSRALSKFTNMESVKRAKHIYLALKDHPS